MHLLFFWVLVLCLILWNSALFSRCTHGHGRNGCLSATNVWISATVNCAICSNGQWNWRRVQCCLQPFSSWCSQNLRRGPIHSSFPLFVLTSYDLKWSSLYAETWFFCSFFSFHFHSFINHVGGFLLYQPTLSYSSVALIGMTSFVLFVYISLIIFNILSSHTDPM